MHSKKNNSSKTQNFIQGLRPLASSVPHGLKKILRKGGYNFSNIVDNWSKMVGKDISNSCYPNTIKINKDMHNGLLVLNVIHGNELSIEYKKKEIIDKINTFFGYSCIKEIRLKIVQAQKKLKKENMKKKKKIRTYNNSIDNIKNDNLKSSLDKLIKAFDDKNN